MTRVENLFIGRGAIIWDQGGTFSKVIDRGSHGDVSRRGTCFSGGTKSFLPAEDFHGYLL